MAQGDIAINEDMCLGCGYCAHLCPTDCIIISKDKFNPSGFLLPVFAEPDKCNACGICSRICPQYAIDVYKYSETKN